MLGNKRFDVICVQKKKHFHATMLSPDTCVSCIQMWIGLESKSAKVRSKLIILGLVDFHIFGLVPRIIVYDWEFGDSFFGLGQVFFFTVHRAEVSDDGDENDEIVFFSMEGIFESE